MKLFARMTMVCFAIVASAACDRHAPLAPEMSRSDASSAFAHPSLNQVHTSGNGAPSGSHYNLNIIGVSRDKSADMTGDNGHRIFVPLFGNPKIMLSEGPDFAVIDANGTDGEAAFQLPNPDPNGDGTTTYSVFARAVGTPGGKSLTTTCAIDPSDGSEVCSVISLTLERKHGQPTFENVSKDLLFIYADINGDGVLDRVSLFDKSLQSYFWDYDNTGLKVAQLRFYNCSTTVPSPTDPTGGQTTTCF